MAIIFSVQTARSGEPEPRQRLFLPKTVRAGFVPAQPPEYYGTENEPLADGHIFNFIDGGGVVYLNHGFRAVAHLLYKDEKANGSMTVDIFDMGTGQNARAAFADKAICPICFAQMRGAGTGGEPLFQKPNRQPGGKGHAQVPRRHGLPGFYAG